MNLSSQKSMSVLVVALAMTGACTQKADAPESPQAPASPSQTADPGAADPAAAAPAPTSVSPAADKALVAIKAEARKILAADRTAVSNQGSYDQAVKRHLRDMEDTGLNRRLAAEPLTEQGLRRMLSEHCVAKGLVLEKVQLGEPPPQPAIPAEHRGDSPYRYSADQLVATAPLQVVVASDDEEKLKRWWVSLPVRVDPLVELVAVSIEDGRATFHGSVYWRRKVTPPVHVTSRPSVEQLAQLAGVAVPTGHPRMAEVEALLEEHRAVHASLGPAMAALGKANLLGSLFQFYRQRVKAIGSRAFPKPMKKSHPPQP